jgi:hypothetical protein
VEVVAVVVVGQILHTAGGVGWLCEVVLYHGHAGALLWI